MNLFQAVNGAATFFILSALVAGLAKHLTDLPDSPLAYFAAHKSILWLGLFMIVFRVKTMLDDHKHFAEPQQGTNAFRYAGFVLALLSWIFWAIAAYLLPDTRRASELMAASILVSTLWLAVHVTEIMLDPERRNAEVLVSVMREKWVAINVGYMLCLVAHVGWFEPLVKAGEVKALWVLLFALALDVLTARSFRGVVK